MNYQLLVRKGRSATQTILVPDNGLTIGRQDSCELTVRSSQVSRKHCQLFEKKGLLLVKDLGSSNGTFVNKDRVEEQRVLEPGDLLTIGPIEFEIAKVSEPAPAEAATGASAGQDQGQSTGPADTNVPEAEATETTEAIPLDEDDVLSFVTGNDEEVESEAPTKTPETVQAPKKSSKSSKKSKSSGSKSSQSKGKPQKSQPQDTSKEQPADEEESGAADEAVSEFLMNLDQDKQGGS